MILKNTGKGEHKKSVKRFFNKILLELSPENLTCDICGAETFKCNFCEDCFKEITFNNGHTCPICGRRTYRPEICMQCKNKPPLFKKAVSAFVYEKGVAALIAKSKNGKPYLKNYFADKICECLVGFPQIDCIVYVPLTKSSLYKRGYNQGRLLASALSERIFIPVIYGAFKKVKKNRMQKGLKGKQRIENVKGVFKLQKRSDIKGKSVLIVDDVMTTGATVNEITRLLLNAGAGKVYVATAASVEYPNAEKQVEK